VRELPEQEGEPLGIYLKSLDDDDRGEYRSDFAAWRAKYAAIERGLAEEKRVLYVAWTRASERLLLLGSLKPDKEFDKQHWAHQLLRALEVRDWEGAASQPCVRMVWPDAVQPGEARPHTPAIEAARKALQKGKLPLPAPIDAALVAPVGEAAAKPRAFDPEAVEFGTLVHAGLERRLRGAEVGVLDARALSHVQRAAEALATLGKARRELPEFGFMTPDGPRRLDLLRELANGGYEIIDYKTDTVESDLAGHAETHHGEQLRGYAAALREYLKARGREAKRVRLFVCFTAPDGLRPAQRLVEIAPGDSP